jgi:hypothetical protein
MSLWPLIVFHICAGSVGLLSGAVAMSFRKGSGRHGLAGDVFVISMLCMSGSAATVGLIKYLLTSSHAQLANFFVGTLINLLPCRDGVVGRQAQRWRNGDFRLGWAARCVVGWSCAGDLWSSGGLWALRLKT